jgi:hypothetical protein
MNRAEDGRADEDKTLVSQGATRHRRVGGISEEFHSIHAHIDRIIVDRKVLIALVLIALVLIALVLTALPGPAVGITRAPPPPSSATRITGGRNQLLQDIHHIG